MRIAGPVITLACGIAVLVGVFLPWLSVSMWGITVSLSGWDAIQVGISDAPEPFVVLIGGILMIACALPAFIVSLATKGAKGVVRALGIVASIAALIAIGGGLWAIIPAISDGIAELIGYGLYICIAAAVLGLGFGIVTSVTTKEA
jgi:hypothetical protein